jgi:hypothetical protein
MSEHNNQPITKVGTGTISAAVWANEEQRDGKTRTRFSIKIQKRWRKKDGSWDTAECHYFPEELPKLRLVIDEVYKFVMLKESTDAEETVSIQE